MSNTLFWDVDTQIDFMQPGGKLYVPGAEKLAPRIEQLTQFAAEHGVPIIASACAHVPTDPEFATYPPHCLVGTAGQKKISGSVLPNHFVIPNRKIELPDNLAAFAQIILEKQATDVFSNPNTDDVLAALCAKWNCKPESVEIILYGVVTEICVELAARGLLQRNYRVSIVGDAIQHLSPELGRATIEYVQQHGGCVTTSEEVMSGFVLPRRRSS